MLCPDCGATNPDDDLFCEVCGVPLQTKVMQTKAESCSCGVPLEEMDTDGFCTGCGRRLKKPDSDRLELAVSDDFAGVSDRGLRHHRNEDRFGLICVGDAFGIVVCDGVSMSPDADQASAAGVASMMASFQEGLPKTDEAELMRSSILRATESVAALAQGRPEAPSTTLVAAIVKGGRVTVGWLGDSRAYWLGQGTATQLTKDHSWEDSHALTRWVGADAGDAEPEIAQHQLALPGLLLICSDGLWNYAAGNEEMAALVASSSANALAISRGLVKFALDQGGHDNITAAVLRYPILKGPSDAR
jgi:serine/threonine protein phosphatase PrpC